MAEVTPAKIEDFKQQQLNEFSGIAGISGLPKSEPANVTSKALSQPGRENERVFLLSVKEELTAQQVLSVIKLLSKLVKLKLESLNANTSNEGRDRLIFYFKYECGTNLVLDGADGVLDILVNLYNNSGELQSRLDSIKSTDFPQITIQEAAFTRDSIVIRKAQLVKSIRESRCTKRLSGADLRGTYLDGADLRGADLRGADLSEAHLSEADLSEANLSTAFLREANLSGANLSEANLSRTYLNWADLSRANLSRADLTEIYLSWAYLRGADLSQTNLSEANLSEANLSRANLSEANLSCANLSRANLSRADLGEANLSQANLSQANLSEAYFIGTDLSGADLSRANLSQAYFSRADLNEANLIEANFNDAVFRNNLGLSKLNKSIMQERGAIFEDSPESDVPSLEMEELIREKCST